METNLALSGKLKAKSDSISFWRIKKPLNLERKIWTFTTQVAGRAHTSARPFQGE